MLEKDLYFSYQELKKEIGRLYFYQTPRIIFCERVITEPFEYEQIAILSEALEKLQFQNAKELLQIIFTQKLPRLDDAMALSKILDLVTSSVSQAWNNEYDETLKISSIELYQELLSLPNVFAAYDRLNNILSQMESTQKEKRQERLTKIKTYVENHYSEDISLAALGDLIDVSEAYMSQFFKQQFGIPFKVYLKNMRMKKAEEMLLNGSYKIRDIGEKTGYSSTPYFCLVFKNHFGITPSEYVRRYSN